MRKHRSHEQHDYEHIGDPVDYISNLPDCILHHILSFMPTKDVVKTSILSTRWKNLWAFVPNIDFDDELICIERVDGGRRSFVNFVERVLRLRDASSNMEKFRLSCRCHHDASQIHSWISNVIMHNVQELDLSLRANDLSAIPLSKIFDSTSLVSLKIRMGCAIQLPSHVSFPCLKTLHLSSVWFLHDDFTKELFSVCPVLEELVIIGCCLRKLKNIVISSSTLKRLTLRDLSLFATFDDDRSGCKIKIDAANLTYFEYTGYLLNEIILNNTSSLEKAFVNILHANARLSEVARRALDLFKQLQYVVSLRLTNHTMENILFADNNRFPVFPNLTHLMLTTEIGMNHTFRVLMGLLSLCPVLQSIYFSEGFKPYMQLGKNNSVWSSIPVCMKNCLKTLTLKNFHGYSSEICFLKCVLKYSRALVRMDICWSQTYLVDLKRKTKVRKDLGNVKRCSTASVIKFL